jgi:endonuclease/exonuclease/phosphatase (EEP) superfamily protein YafD
VGLLGGGERERRRRRGRRLWRWLDIFAAALLLYLGLWWTTGDRFWPVFALGYVAHLLLPAAALALPLALYRRRWRSVILESVCALAFVWLFRDVVLGRDPQPPPEGAPVLTVLTYNLGNGLASPDRVVSLLREAGADVVGLQEVDAAMAAALAVDLHDRYPYQTLHGLGIPGKGLLSRYPIVQSDLLELNPGRPDLRVVLDLNGVQITVVVAHPPPPQMARTGLRPRPGGAEQLDALIATAEAIDGPLLFLGDFNLTRMHDGYQRLEAAGLRDVYRLAGHGAGFTTPTRLAKLAERGSVFGKIPLPPLLRIDYVWISTHWQPLDAWVGDDAGSDHLPVIARVALVLA